MLEFDTSELIVPHQLASLMYLYSVGLETRPCGKPALQSALHRCRAERQVGVDLGLLCSVLCDSD